MPRHSNNPQPRENRGPVSRTKNKRASRQNLEADTFKEASDIFKVNLKTWTTDEQRGALNFAKHLITGQKFVSSRLPQSIKDEVFDAVQKACGKTGLTLPNRKNQRRRRK